MAISVTFLSFTYFYDIDVYVCLFRHSHCELDQNCPYFILLKFNENKCQVERTIVDILEQHFKSFLHFIDFVDDVKQGHSNSQSFNERTRNLMFADHLEMERF